MFERRRGSPVPCQDPHCATANTVSWWREGRVRHRHVFAGKSPQSSDPAFARGYAQEFRADRPGQSLSCRCNRRQRSYHDRPPGGSPYKARNRRTRPLQAPKSAADPSDGGADRCPESGLLPIHERFRGRCKDPTGWCSRPRAERFLTLTSPPPVIGLRHCNQKKPPKGRAAPRGKAAKAPLISSTGFGPRTRCVPLRRRESRRRRRPAAADRLGPSCKFSRDGRLLWSCGDPRGGLCRAQFRPEEKTTASL